MENSLGGADGARGVLTPAVRIEPVRAWESLNLREVWEHRELLYFLIWRDLKVRYKQTVLGAAWAILSPVLTMLVFSVIFGLLAGLPSDGVPYPVFTYCALLPWQLFMRALGAASTSLLSNQGLITKVYFPRLVIPLSGIFGGIVDFAIGFVFLLVLMAFYGWWPGWGILAVPLLMILALATALAVGLWLAALSVKYRDVQQLMPFLTQLWLYATPIAYSSSLIPPRFRLLYGLNPMVGVVDGFRAALLGQTAASGPMVAVSVGVVLVLLVTGIYYFRRVENTFADVV